MMDAMQVNLHLSVGVLFQRMRTEYPSVDGFQKLHIAVKIPDKINANTVDLPINPCTQLPLMCDDSASNRSDVPPSQYSRHHCTPSAEYNMDLEMCTKLFNDLTSKFNASQQLQDELSTISSDLHNLVTILTINTRSKRAWLDISKFTQSVFGIARHSDLKKVYSKVLQIESDLTNIGESHTSFHSNLQKFSNITNARVGNLFQLVSSSTRQIQNLSESIK